MALPLFLLTALLGPFFLLLIERVLPYPSVVEEVFKLVVLILFSKGLYPPKFNYLQAAIFGLLFGLSESVMYLTNIYYLQSLTYFWARFPTVILMHASNMIILNFYQQKKIIPLGLSLAIMVHFLYNSIVTVVF